MEVDVDASSNAAAQPKEGEEKTGGKLHVLGIGGRRAKKGNSKTTGSKKTPGEIRIQKGELSLQGIPWVERQQQYTHDIQARVDLLSLPFASSSGWPLIRPAMPAEDAVHDFHGTPPTHRCARTTHSRQNSPGVSHRCVL